MKKKSLLFLIDFCLTVLIFLFVFFFSKSSFFNTLSWIAKADALAFALSGIICSIVVAVMRSIFGVYRAIWRYATSDTYFKLLVSDAISGVISSIGFAISKRYSIGLALYLIFFALNCLVALGIRFAYQLLYQRMNIRHDSDENNHKINIAIVGAGNVGANLAQELLRNPKAHYNPICFIDKDSQKAGLMLNGLPVYSADEKVIERIKSMPISEIVIALPESDGETRNYLYDFYKETGCKIKIYDYPLDDNGKKRGLSIREMKVEDLLFRDGISFDNALSREFYNGKTVLITGGGGSIGSELCRQIAMLSPKKLVIFDIYENNAYGIQQELLQTYGKDLDLEVLIGSVRDTERLDEVFSRVRPDIVLHAAAHKHVPLMEVSPMEAIKNNVFGTYNTANAAEKYGVEKFVLISTDKAVNPTSVMGASKRLCEMVIQCRLDSKTQFVAVRFGNVLGSNGSVIPLFQREIENGGPITITDKRIIRYFMTIPEASQLVLEAGAMAKNGELFVLDMGKPVRIYDLALNMIKFAGLTVGKDIDIVEVGLRPGEKLYEELLMNSGKLYKTDNSLIFVEKDAPLTRDEVEDKLAVLKDALAVSTAEAVKDAVRKTVPTFNEPELVNEKAEKVMVAQTSNEGDSYTNDMLKPKN